MFTGPGPASLASPGNGAQTQSSPGTPLASPTQSTNVATPQTPGSVASSNSSFYTTKTTGSVASNASTFFTATQDSLSQTDNSLSKFLFIYKFIQLLLNFHLKSN